MLACLWFTEASGPLEYASAKVARSGTAMLATRSSITCGGFSIVPNVGPATAMASILRHVFSILARLSHSLWCSSCAALTNSVIGVSCISASSGVIGPGGQCMLQADLRCMCQIHFCCLFPQVLSLARRWLLFGLVVGPLFQF